jgi:hypothetical protein
MYKLTNNNMIQRMDDNVFIPFDEANTDYQQYIFWIAEGNTPQPVDPSPVVIPQQITMKQARVCLIINGLYTQINTAIQGLTGVAGEIAKVEWEYSTTMERNNILVQQITTELNWTSEQLDALFTQAATL